MAAETQLTLGDAFLIPVLVAEIGIPGNGLRFLSSLGGAPELADKIIALAGAYGKTGADVGTELEDLQARLARYGLVMPPIALTHEAYLAWNAAVLALVAGATAPGSPARAAAALGQSLGELMQTMALHIVVEDFRGASNLAWLEELDIQLAHLYAEQLERFTDVTKLPTLGQAIGAIGARMAAISRIAAMPTSTLTAETRVARKKMVFAKLAEATVVLRQTYGA